MKPSHILRLLFVISLSCKYALSFSYELSDGSSLIKGARDEFEIPASFTSTIADDIKQDGDHEISCESSLEAHSDRIMSEVEDPLRLVSELVGDSPKKAVFGGLYNSALKGLKSLGCGAKQISSSLNVQFARPGRVRSTVFFNADLPPAAGLPMMYGEISRNCRILTRKGPSTKRLVLRHMDYVDPIEAMGSENDREGVKMLLEFGVRGIVFDVVDEAKVDVHIALKCHGSPSLGERQVKVCSDVEVGKMRELLLNLGVEHNKARSFMVTGIHSQDLQ